MHLRHIISVLALLVILLAVAGCTSGSSDPGSIPATSGTTTGSGDLVVDVSAMDTILTSVYQQMPNLDMTFIDFAITNTGADKKTVTVESEVQGFTEKSINTVEIPAKTTQVIGQTPSLKIAAIPREMTNANLHYRVTSSDGTVIDEQTIPVKVYAKDTIIWEINDDNESTDLSRFIGAWVTPHEPQIDVLVRKAAEYHPQHSLGGYQCGDSCSAGEWSDYTDDQVKSIYDALRNDYDLTYINSAIVYGKDNENPQHVRLPVDSLATGSANCIDGTVLYASALENIDINPEIVITGEHAFLCYDRSPDGEDIGCVETTMTRSASFEEASAAGMEEYNEEIQNGNFESSKSQIFSIKELREAGIRPML